MIDIAETSLLSVFPGGAVLNADDLRMYAAGHRLYAIFLTPRSGSTWLTHQARLSGRLGTPQEWFNEDYIRGEESVFDCAPPRTMGVSNINAYVKRLIATTASLEGNAGIQLSRYQTEAICEVCDNPDRILRLVTPFYLRRRNIVAQAISLYRSSSSGYYHSYQGPRHRKAFDNQEYNEEKIRNNIWFLLNNEIWFEWMMQRYRLEPHRFAYEDMLESMSATLSWMYKTITGRPIFIEATDDNTVSKLADDKSLEWEFRFLKTHEAFIAEHETRRLQFNTDPKLTDEIKEHSTQLNQLNHARHNVK